MGLRYIYLRNTGNLCINIKLIPFLKEQLICYYSSWILFLRSFFLKERPGFIIFISMIYPAFTFVVPTDVTFDAFIQMRILLIIGVYLISVDTIGSYISEIILNKKYPYLNDFFQNRENYYISAGWSAIIIGKTPMTPTGRAAIAAGIISGGAFLYNGYLQRTHDASQAAQQRAHEASQAARQRAFQNFLESRKSYDSSFFKKGERPQWNEDQWDYWSKTK